VVFISIFSKSHFVAFRMYTLMVSVMVKESVIRGEPWKTSVVEEICYAIRFFPSDLQPIAYQWMEYIAKERATWIAYSLFSNVQQPLITSSLVPDIAACCIRIVCQVSYYWPCGECLLMNCFSCVK